MPYGRGEASGARAFLSATWAANPHLRGGRGHPPSEWTDAYAVRIANSIERQLAAGAPITRQAARGHAATPEHPPVIDKGGIERKQYRDFRAALAYIHSLPEQSVHTEGFGVLRGDYTGKVRPFEVTREEGKPAPMTWRSVIAGTNVGPDQDPGYADLVSFRDVFHRIFEAVAIIEVRTEIEPTGRRHGPVGFGVTPNLRLLDWRV